MPGDRDRVGVTRRIGDEIGETTLERRRPHGHDRPAVEADARLVAVALGVGLELIQERGHVGWRRLLAGIATREGEIGLQHARHLVHVLLHRLDLGALAEKRELELEAGEHGAQIVGDAGEHGGALLHGALDASLHLDEGERRAPHLARAARAEVRNLTALAEAFGGVGEPQDRADLVAQEQHRHGDQQQRGSHHPGEEDVRVGDIGGAARREHAHDRIVELDADLEQRRAPDRVDPERAADLLAHLVRERLVDQGEEGLWARRRQLVGRQEVDHQAELLLRNPSQLPVIGLLGIDLVDLDQGGDVLHHAGREPLRHQVVVALHEHERHDRLQHHHGRDDDEQRARIEAFRHHALQRAAGAFVECVEALRRGAQHGYAGRQLGRGGAQRLEPRAQRGDADVERSHDTNKLMMRTSP